MLPVSPVFIQVLQNVESVKLIVIAKAPWSWGRMFNFCYILSEGGEIESRCQNSKKPAIALRSKREDFWNLETKTGTPALKASFWGLFRTNFSISP